MIIGVIWISSSNMSFDFIVRLGLINVGTAPWLMVVYIVKEYAAAKNLINMSIIILIFDEDKIEVSNRISLIKLIEGGAPIFQAANKNHHMEIVGHIINSPLVRYILRVWDISYVKFAKINRADEHSPWATIIIKDPYIAQFVFVIIAAKRRPICPTEE